MFRRFRDSAHVSPAESALFEAVARGEVGAVKLALGGDLDAPSRPLCYNEDGKLAIHVAATSGHIPACDALRLSGVGAVADDSTTERLDDDCGGCAVIRMLAERAPACLGMGDGSGFTALHLAAASGPSGAVRTLLAAGADPTSRKEYNAHGGGTARSETGCVALHFAVNNARVEIVRMLALHSPASLAAGDRRGRTPLHYAVRNPRVYAACAVALLDAGADLHTASADGTTPLSVLCGLADDEFTDWGAGLEEARQALYGLRRPGREL